MTLENKKTLVTGATGFIGGHLARRLAQEEGATVTGVGRNLDAVPFLKDVGVDLQVGNLLDFRRMAQLMAGKDIVFDVAAWMGPRHGGPEMAWPLNVFAPLQLIRAAAEAGIMRYVMVSSIAAYGPPDRPLMDESHPVDPLQADAYGRTKAEGEIRALELAQELGLELAIVRPGMVYGPRSYGWSVRLYRLVERGVPVIFGNGEGHAHPVYIDNLVDGMILAATRPEAVGTAFNFVDQPLPWREWFTLYGQMAGRKPVSVPLSVARLLLRTAGRVPLLNFSVDSGLLNYYTSQVTYPTTKAERLLGYRQRTSLTEGMYRTQQWLQAEGIAPGKPQ